MAARHKPTNLDVSLYDRDSKIVLPEGVAIIFESVICKMYTAPGTISKVLVIQNVIVEPGNVCTPIRFLSLDCNLRMSSRGWRWLSWFWSQNLTWWLTTICNVTPVSGGLALPFDPSRAHTEYTYIHTGKKHIHKSKTKQKPQTAPFTA